MTTPTLRVQGIEELRAAMSALADQYGREVAKALLTGGNLVRNTSIKWINEKSQGEIVQRQRQSGVGTYDHTASRPGDPPNTDTGALTKSVQVEVRQDGVYVGSSLDYALYLEIGTSNMAERPWLVPSLTQNTPAIRKLIADAVQKASQ
jgi:HK97 gp10 family phage protein